MDMDAWDFDPRLFLMIPWMLLLHQRFIWLPVAWRCTSWGNLPSLCPMPASPCSLSIKGHSAIGVLQRNPSPLPSLSGEDVASAVQMILGLLGKMTQERGNMGLQWDSALLSPRSRSSRRLLWNGVILKNMLILKKYAALFTWALFLPWSSQSLSTAPCLSPLWWLCWWCGNAQVLPLHPNPHSKNYVGLSLLYPMWLKHALL